MKPRLAILALFMTIVLNVHADPRLITSQSGNIEGTWRFRTDPDLKGDQENWARPDYDDSAWRTLQVPGLWEPQGITETRPGSTTEQDAYNGVAWYRLRFTVPATWADQPLELRLGIVDDEDRTYLNGKQIGETLQGATLSRRYAIPPNVIQPKSENVLVIRVKDGGGPGGIPGPMLTLLPKNDFQDSKPLLPSNRPFTERFQTPPADARILKIVHGLPDDASQQDDKFAQLMLQGFGGIVTNVSFDEYLASDAKWAAFVRGVNEAQKRGMSMWLYDEHGYPSGNAGGLTLRDHPDWEAEGCFVSDTLVTGGPVMLDLPPGKLLQGVAYPVENDTMCLEQSIDLTGQVKDGKLIWDAPPGKTWRVMAITNNRLYEGTHAAISLCDKLPYINLLRPEPTARFIELTHEAYAQHLDNDLRKWFVATFTDEPSLMSLFFKKQPWRVVPWGPNVPEAFRKAHGYDIEPLLPALFADAGAKGKAVRYDYWQTVGQLVADNYFGQLQAWGRKHHIPSGGHLLLEESLLTHMPLYGDFFRCVRRLDAPSIDCLTSIPSEVPWYIGRLIGSVADLEHHPITMCELSDHSQRYRPPGDTRPVVQVSEQEIRGSLNRLMVAGINTFTSYYSFDGITTEQLNRLNEWTGRVCTAIRGGCQATDIALIYPIESVWTRFVPATRWVNDSHHLERTYRDASENLFRNGRDFTYIDSRALIDAVNKKDVLQNGALRWRAVVLPAVDTLPMAAWKRLAEFWRHGGIVIALAERPANSERAFPDDRVVRLSDEIFGTSPETVINVNAQGGAGVFLPIGSESMLSRVLDTLLEKDLVVSEQPSPIRYTHRTLDGQQIYFVINDSTQEVSSQLHLASTGHPEQWDPATGKCTQLDQAENIPLKLGPYGGMIYRIDHAQKPKRLSVKSGGLPKITFGPLPDATPQPSAAGSVKYTFSKANPVLFSNRPLPAWDCVATLTQNDVDTFLFASFDYPSPVDLSKALCFAFAGHIPEKQVGAPSLIVLMRDKHGNECLSQSLRSLNEAGAFSIYLGPEQFTRAGWSKETGHPFDWSQIDRISIGWGGHKGVDGQVLQFTVTALQQGTLSAGS